MGDLRIAIYIAKP